MLTLLTPTGNRPQAWKLCQRWMLAQDYTEHVRWIVVDDGTDAQPITFSRRGWTMLVIRPPAMRGNSQSRNLLAGLEEAGHGPLAIIEDDDWYGPNWLSTVARELQGAELVGECRARYYNVERRCGRQLQNTAHASLCSTAMQGAAIDAFVSSCMRQQTFIDLDLWSRFHSSAHLFTGHRVVGIKGMPGRHGIGSGHKRDFVGQLDPDGHLLRDWIGYDADAYLKAYA